jgi:hypothetical protein
LCLVTQKMENKSFYFKWHGFKGFRKEYLLKLTKEEIKFDLSESFEQRIQVYTRNFILTLFNKPETGMSSEQSEDLMKQCGLENQQRHIEKIHLILKFLNFITIEKQSSNQHMIFTTLPSNSNTANPQLNQCTFKIHKCLLDEALAKDINYAEKFYVQFNETILNKYEKKAEEVEVTPNTGVLDSKLVDNDSESILTAQRKEFESTKQLDLNEMNELEQYKVNVTTMNSENDESGFAVLRGNNWSHCMKKLYCIIGRSPVKYGVNITESQQQGNNQTPVSQYGHTSWQVDVDLGQNRKISKQHALIVYNFQTSIFEIKNLSKKFPIKVNGEVVKYKEDMPLSSKSCISIGSQEFYFLLPI